MNIKSFGATTTTDKKAMRATLDMNIKALDNEIKITQLNCQNKIEYLKSKKQELMKEKRQLAPVRKKNNDWY